MAYHCYHVRPAHAEEPKIVKTNSITYADAGVDVARAERAKRRIKLLARKTFNKNVLADIGSFGALYALDKRRFKSPVLVSSADGVGTKLKIAFALNQHRSTAADLVNHCVNDIAVQGATPLFFLDYFACGRLAPAVIEQVVEGLSTACRANGCALIGGETAEMPGFYPDGEYDLAGFIVGIVERNRIVDGRRIREGDIVLGLPSTGLHTNGYSLARKLLLETAGYSLQESLPRLKCTVGEELLKPHRSYLKPLQRLTEAGILNGAAHITGGGLPGNLPRILPKGLEARLQAESWPELPVFGLLRELGHLPDAEVWRAFNMGIGMALMVSPRDLDQAGGILKKLREPFYRIGRVARGNRGARFDRF
ncbi:MAG: phosphoribosylformylglycinamidine cyclo-ligase [Acidobacteria bacterium]|nr:phosphoribosylformylglycinamidine cyclo-ligase [Acidobacteriota bacterium]